MAATKSAAFSGANAALSLLAKRGILKGVAMVEVIFMAQLVRKPLQAMARRWYCRSLFRATRRARRCPECTAS
jgi:hypothetical protein